MVKLHIKNMVCHRCKMAVKAEFEKLGTTPASIELGEVEIVQELSPTQKSALNAGLVALGFELMDDKKGRVVEKIKNLMIDLVHSKNNELQTNLSTYIASEIGQDYSYISNLFSQAENATIEQYYILLKIERVKELLVYDEMSLSQIAFLLNYSTTSHLSKQFKKVTGLTVTHFKTLRTQKRQQLENL
jgi:AraC-like DNA-binding protein